MYAYDDCYDDEDAAEERAWRERRSRKYLRASSDHPEEWEDWMDEYAEENYG